MRETEVRIGNSCKCLPLHATFGCCVSFHRVCLLADEDSVMKRITRGLLMIVAGVGALSPMLAVAQVAQPANGRGAVFVMTNAADKNQIIAYSR